MLTSALPQTLLNKPLLFATPVQRLTSSGDAGFTLRLEGEFDTGESLWSHIASTAEWVIEIDASRPVGKEERSRPLRHRTHASPTRTPDSSPAKVHTIPHPEPDRGPFFQGRMLVQVNPKDKMIQRQHVRKESGIRVYVEGFRVLPYGDQGNDWLALDSDYTRRSTIQYANELEAIFASMQQDTKWSSLLLPNRSYFGAVFVTQEDAGDLTPLINREGFLPNDAFYRLRHIVRIGIDLFTRVRASVEYRERTDARSNRRISEPVRGSIVLSTIVRGEDCGEQDPSCFINE